MKDQMPKWILVISGLIGVLAIALGCSLYLTPGAFIPDIDFSDAQIKYLSNMWAARQISVGFILLFSIIYRSVPMLKVSLIAYTLMNLQDIFIGVSNGDNSLIIGASIFFILPALMIYRLSGK